MKKSSLHVLFTIILMQCLSPTMAQFGEIPTGPDYEIIPLAGDVYRYRNLRHYSVFMVTPAGVILSDPISEKGALWLKAELKNRFNAEVKYVAYSHYHADHASGGAVFADTATFVGHNNMLKYFKPAPTDTPLSPAMQRADANNDGVITLDEAPQRLKARFAALDKDSNGALSGAETAAIQTEGVHPPDITFIDTMTLVLSGKTVQLIYPGPNHTDDMVVLYFPEEKVAHTVDYITIDRLPRSMSLWSEHVPAAIKAVEALDFDIFSAGHEGTGNKGDVVEHREYVEDLLAGVEVGIAKGQSLEVIQETIDLEKHSYLGLFEEYVPANVKGVYDAVMAKRIKSEQAIYTLIDNYAQSRDTKDEALLGSILTENIDQLASSGNWRTGRTEAMAYMMRSSTTSPGDRTIDIEKVRFLNSENAIVDAIYTIQNTDGSARKLLSTFVVINDAGEWKISAIRNMRPTGG